MRRLRSNFRGKEVIKSYRKKSYEKDKLRIVREVAYEITEENRESKRFQI